MVVMMSEDRTQRDKVWVAVIEALNDEETVTAKQVSEDTGVNVVTVAEVLHVAEEIGLLIRETEKANTYYNYAHVAIKPGV